jgi:phosphohistidine phosphatase
MDDRRLVIVRHAKSAWPDGVPDPQRPLNRRGRRDAPAVGRWLRERVGPLDAVVCSPATRARQTWELIAGELDAPPAPDLDERVYAATADTLLAVVRGIPETAGSVLLVGHNPGVADLLAALTGEKLKVKTSMVAVLGLACSWADAAPGMARLVAHATPRG